MQKPDGYRPEMLGLKIADCDFQRKLIHVRRSVESRTRKLQPTKSQASTAALPMPDELGKHLQIFLQHQWREESLFVFRRAERKPKRDSSLRFSASLQRERSE